MKTLLYSIFKIYIKIGLFFYSKKITVLGENNVPKKGAVLFVANHPNALIDPLLIATNTKRKIHFLVRAAVFKNTIAAAFLNLLGLMPIYRIRDGIKQLSKNEAIFNDCQDLLNNKETLLIFAEGSHNRKRTIRPLSKGFTRIIYGALEKYPNLNIHVVPIGLTYQNSSSYPSKVTLNFGKPILANEFYNQNDIFKSIKTIKEQVAHQLENLSVHIANDEFYTTTIQKLDKAQVDFTKVGATNAILKSGSFPKEKKRSKNYASFLYYILLINSVIPYFIWKLLSKKVPEIEFIDTFRFTLSIVLFPLFYILQSLILYFFFDWKIAIVYLVMSILTVLFYTKLSTTPSLK
ncbi:lysophospholipid acyltransferase family protein [Tenacibaculum retecalamus]|uniref:lysophospholipid acyltransferase family protein n=1 Tax=Tenacibaculum retecalamus TaxID=3018315 RepID=UPI0023D91A5F|nr:lysophospholipid acyltransferase family protein [Tenacibaculum retecalamus]WBX72134.1 lysophospholipid acyltransferase family protein [Tenacibaculum retecalamus]